MKEGPTSWGRIKNLYALKYNEGSFKDNYTDIYSKILQYISGYLSTSSGGTEHRTATIMIPYLRVLHSNKDIIK